jgi:ADP-ribosylation factor-binding protein GGA
MVELADMIKSKKANSSVTFLLNSMDERLMDSARDAVHALLGNINSRNPNQSLLGLAVLDHLVKNGGYPIHLQIATKEFLNELVRRFPERPPMVTGRVMGRILEVSYHA